VLSVDLVNELFANHRFQLSIKAFRRNSYISNHLNQTLYFLLISGNHMAFHRDDTTLLESHSFRHLSNLIHFVICETYKYNCHLILRQLLLSLLRCIHQP